MYKKVKYIAVLIIITATYALGNSKYCVYFTDKKNATFNPYNYFEKQVISEQLHKGINPFDSTNFPVSDLYISELKKYVEEITTESRWLNAVVVKCNDEQAKYIRDLSFVKEIEPLNATVKLAKYKFKTSLRQESYSILWDQLTSMQGELFTSKGIDGRGIRIAIFDAGFTGVDKSPVFEHLRKNGQIVKTYDFVRNEENVYAHNNHGTMVLSCIAGIVNGVKIGMATGAEFLLARTESNMETLSEEENWMRAVEWAYQNGVDIINSSLGYTYHRYFESEMDGKTSLVSRAAAMAASKGMLVVNAMGNDGQNSWQYMGAPADVENVMAVGGIDPRTGIHIPFSSFGPTADKRMKPNVSAYAHVVTGSKNKMEEAYGTSFAAPLIAGFAACVLQMNPEFTTEKLFDEIEKSGNLYPYFDYAHGYGIPQAGYFTGNTKSVKPEINIENHSGTIKIKTVNSTDGMLFYNISGENGVLEKYVVIDMNNNSEFVIAMEELSGKTLRIHFKGYTFEKKY